VYESPSRGNDHRRVNAIDSDDIWIRIAEG